MTLDRDTLIQRGQRAAELLADALLVDVIGAIERRAFEAFAGSAGDPEKMRAAFFELQSARGVRAELEEIVRQGKATARRAIEQQQWEKQNQ